MQFGTLKMLYMDQVGGFKFVKLENRFDFFIFLNKKLNFSNDAIFISTIASADAHDGRHSNSERRP
jgi:hypothetical protein